MQRQPVCITDQSYRIIPFFVLIFAVHKAIIIFLEAAMDTALLVENLILPITLAFL